MKRPELNLTKKKDTTKRSLERKQSDPVPDPFADIDYAGDSYEDTATAEASAMLTGFRDRAKREQDRFTLATDSEFWFAIGFQSREQKELFLRAMDWLQYGDKYLNGCHIAEDSKIDLPKVDLPNPTKKPIDKRLAALALKPKGIK